jgi:hypothetical protein
MAKSPLNLHAGLDQNQQQCFGMPYRHRCNSRHSLWWCLCTLPYFTQMKAKYDIQRLHNDCLAWCENPIFPYPWQEVWNLVWELTYWKLKDGRGSKAAIIFHMYGDIDQDVTLHFAYLIGINIESYRIKETRLGAVKRYLDSLSEGDPLWEGSILTLRHDRDAIHGLCDGLRVDLFSEEWTDAMPEAIQAYYFLRLDLNPDYQVEP